MDYVAEQEMEIESLEAIFQDDIESNLYYHPKLSFEIQNTVELFRMDGTRNPSTKSLSHLQTKMVN